MLAVGRYELVILIEYLYILKGMMTTSAGFHVVASIHCAIDCGTCSAVKMLLVSPAPVNITVKASQTKRR